MSDRLAEHFDRLRAGELADYYNELYKREEDFYKQPHPPRRKANPRISRRKANPRISIWDHHEGRLTLDEIDKNYGIEFDDYRVYSIASYQSEWRKIEEDRCRSLREMKTDAKTIRDRENLRYRRRQSACDGHHFRGIKVDSPIFWIDSSPKLWCYIHRCLVHARFLESYGPEYGVCYTEQLNIYINKIYNIMHNLKIDWTPIPPYRYFNQYEVADEAKRIANALESKERELLEKMLFPAANGMLDATQGPTRTPASSVNPKLSKRRGGRPSVADPKEDRRIYEAWKSRQYRSFEDVAQAFMKTKPEVEKAIDRHRHRKQVGKTPTRKSSQGD